MTKRLVCLYTQTHWDREWYWEFEKYRTQLLSVARQIIRELESGAMPNFHLDGQSCALEDIVAVDPQLEEPLAKQIAKKNLRIGPWYVLADQMLVGGESLVRNMERGIKVASKYGEPLKVGYCPDTFGHTQDMPRILKGFGIENAVVWRGVPELDEGPEFFWKSPDGSEVVGYLLPDGYYQTAFQEAQYLNENEAASFLAGHLFSFLGQNKDGSKPDRSDLIGAQRAYSTVTGSTLVPLGGDHLYPAHDATKLVKLAEEKINQILKESRVEIEFCDLEQFLKKVKDSLGQDLELVRLIEGELRTNTASKTHTRAFMLPGVLSSRLYLKRENRLLEHKLNQVFEPLMTLLWSFDLIQYPQVELDQANRLLLLNHPHDSICGCSVDDVHREMMPRYRSVEQIIDMLARRVKEEFLCPGVHEWSCRREEHMEGGNQPAGMGRWSSDLNDPEASLDGIIAFNLSASKVNMPVPFKYAIPLETLNLSSYGHIAELPLDEKIEKVVNSELDRLIARDLPRQIDRVTTQTEVFGSISGAPAYKDVCVIEGFTHLGELPQLGMKSGFSIANVKEKELAHSVSGKTDSMSRTRSPSTSSRDPGGIVPAEVSPINGGVTGGSGGSGVTLTNEYFRVEIDSSGNVEVLLSGGLAESKFQLDPKFIDVADAGDSYNFDPVFNDSELEAKFKKMELVKSGPLVASVELVYEIEIPQCVEISEDRKILAKLDDVDDLPEFKRSDRKVKHEIKTTLSVHCGDPVVHFDTSWINRSRDHRLEVRFNTGQKVKETWSENHFSLVNRPVMETSCELPVKRAYEAPLDRFPCQRFFVANGQVFLNKGLPEYAVLGDLVSITLLRAFSMLSRKRLLTRGGGAGPYMPTPDGNCLGENIVSYGWTHLSILTGKPVGKANLNSVERQAAYRFAEMFMNPVWTSFVSNKFYDTFKTKLEKLSGTGQPEEEFFSFQAIEVDNPGIRISAMYKIESQEAFLLRLLNVTEEKTSTGLGLNLPVKSVFQTDLAGETQKEITLSDNRCRLEFGRNELVTLKVSLNSN